MSYYIIIKNIYLDNNKDIMILNNAVRDGYLTHDEKMKILDETK